jgi:DHA1 family multidrug resistance protein-like MFS transporter
MKRLFPSIPEKGVFIVAISQFEISFSMNFIMAFMPFYILKISPFELKETLIWTGLIMAATSTTAAVMAPVWGGLANRIRPKLLYERAILSNGIIMVLFGFARNLYLLLFLRALLGLLGGASTVGLILISALSPKERLHKDISLFQIAMTAGQLIAPPIGAYMVTLAGYRASFAIASCLIFIFFTFCYVYVKDIPCPKVNPNPAKPLRTGIFWGWVLAVVATIHITYLPSILPHILENFQVQGAMALNSAGIIMMAYTVTAILGNYLINSFARRDNLRQVVMFIGLSAAFFQAAMYFGKDVLSFTVIRMLQTGVIAAVFPMILSIFAKGVGGGTLGFLNSARFAGNACGPLMATFIVAYSNLATLYFIISGITLVALMAFLRAIKVVASVEQER